jgi:hypothetical protein
LFFSSKNIKIEASSESVVSFFVWLTSLAGGGDKCLVPLNTSHQFKELQKIFTLFIYLFIYWFGNMIIGDLATWSNGAAVEMPSWRVSSRERQGGLLLTVDLCLMVRVLVFYWFVIVGIVCELVQVVTECQPSIVWDHAWMGLMISAWYQVRLIWKWTRHVCVPVLLTVLNLSSRKVPEHHVSVLLLFHQHWKDCNKQNVMAGLHLVKVGAVSFHFMILIFKILFFLFRII